MVTPVKIWKGTFEAWQNHEFAAIYSENTRQQLYCTAGFHVFVSKRIFLGATTVYAYCLPDDPKKLAAVEALARRIGAARIKIYSIAPIAARKDYFKENSLTLVFDLKSNIDEMWKNIGNKTRNMVRKGQNCGIVVRQAANKEEFNQWWEIYRRLCAKNKFAAQNYGLVGQIFELPEISRLFLSLKDGKIVAGSFFLISGYPMYWLGAFDKSYPCGHANIWTALASFKKDNFFLVDLGGISANEKDGTTTFKKQFSQNVQKGYIYEIPANPIKCKIIDKLGLIRKLIKI